MRNTFLYVLATLFYTSGIAAISTNDHLDLNLKDTGQIQYLLVDSRALPLSADRALISLRDVGKSWHASPLHSNEIDASLTSHDGYLQLDGNVIDTTGTDRCVDLKICLPLDPSQFKLDNNIGHVKPFRKGKSRALDFDLDVSDPADDAHYPIISANSASAGISLAVPPTHPTRFLTGMDKDGLFILLRIGLSKDSATPSHTPFRVIIYRHDPQWGLRSALSRYYDFYRGPFFTRRVERIGAWFTENPSALRHPKLYAYHAAGFPTWHTPEGTLNGVNVKPTLEHRGEYNVCHSLTEYQKLCELALDKKLGIYALPYTIVGQRQIIELPSLPKTYDEAMQTLNTWTTKDPIPFDGQPQAVSFRSATELKDIIRNSTIDDPQGHLTYFARPYRGPTLTFVQNPDPNLFRDDNRETIAKYTLDYYLPMMFTSPYVDGCYNDSLGRWCSFYNYRKEHWKYANVPLTYAGDPAKPCLWTLQSHAEYLQELSRRLHKQNKIFIANGVHPDRVMLGFYCDVIGTEGAPGDPTSENFYTARFAAGTKPYCFLNAPHHINAKIWNNCLYMGFLMGCNTEAASADEEKYLPLIIEMNKAGWQPVTYARCDDTNIGIERWGNDNTIYFSIMNRSDKARNADIAADLKSLNLESHSAIDTFKHAVVEMRGEKFHIPLKSWETTVLKLERQ